MAENNLLNAVVSIAAADGVSVQEVIKRGHSDLMLRLAFFAGGKDDG